MSEETEETNIVPQAEKSNVASMDSTEFESKLTEFFTQHKESKLRLVPRIVEEFKGHETKVLEHLHNKYVLGIVPEKSKKKHHKKTEESSEAETNAEVKPKKSKKKLIIIIAIIVVLCGLGAVGFLMKDKFMGKHEESAKTEPTATETPATEQPKQKETPAPEAKTEEAAPAENTESVPPDSVKNE